MMGRSLKQMEIDIKNAQTDKTAPSNDRFVEVMSISFFAFSRQINDEELMITLVSDFRRV